MVNLTGPRLKLSRANKHLRSLKQAIDRFLKSEPYSFTIEHHPNPPTDMPRAQALVAHIHKQPSNDWGVIVGDIIHNLRSTLDLLVSSLSSLPARSRTRRKLQFPICDSAKEFKEAIKGQRLYDVCNAHRTLIRSYQPYRRCKIDNLTVANDALGILRELNNADKHRSIQVVGAVARYQGIILRMHGSPVRVIAAGGAGLRLGATTDPCLSYSISGSRAITEDGTVVAVFENKSKRRVYVNPSFQPSIQFWKGCSRVKDRPVLSVLSAIRDRVKEILGEPW